MSHYCSNMLCTIYETLMFQGGKVTGYQIMSSSGGYNVTASPLAKDSCLGSDCVYNQNVKTTGALYTVTMASINGGGVGPWSDPVQGKGKMKHIEDISSCENSMLYPREKGWGI